MIALGVIFLASLILNYLLLSRINRAFGHGLKVPATKLIDFLLIVGKLKATKRTGWVNHKVDLPESVADHMYRLAMMAFCIQDTSLDRNRLAKIGLVHDLAESVVGDITPTEYSGVSKEDKHKREVEAMNKIVSLFHDSPLLANDVKTLWNEYELGNTDGMFI